MLRLTTHFHSPLILSGFLTLFTAFISAHAFAEVDKTVPSAITFPISTFLIDGETPIPESELQPLISNFENKQYGLSDLYEVSKEIEQFIRKKGFSFYRVTLPPQSLSDGSVTFKLVSFALGDVEIQGNRYFSEENIIRSLPSLQQGQSPNTQKLAQEVAVANHHPHKKTSIIFKQSDTADNVSVQLEVIEQKPFNVFISANNTGADSTGNARLTTGFQHSNLWGLDHNLNMSYTTSPNHFSEVSQYSASYSLPLYKAGGWLTTYYSKSDVDSGHISLGGGIGLDVSGSGEMYGLHYLHFLPKINDYEHTLDIGIDNRLFDNTIFLTGIGNIATDVRSTPITLLYKGNTSVKSVQLSHNVSWSKNTGLGSLNENTDYTATRANSSEDWDLIRYGLLATKSINDWTLRANFKGQYSSEPLISGEQFGLGGAYSVRGYNEREANMDIGNSVSFEVYTPPWKNLTFLGFVDYGKGRNHDAAAGNVNKDVKLGSFGLGFRWQWQQYILTSIDIGRTLAAVGDTADNHNHAHANIVIQF